ncbi:MAG: hypothetical protein FWE06_04790 [Oscillospiraceae bacterium]|nr:hypothetical protein [Oscillospiraceae bacterium]
MKKIALLLSLVLLVSLLLSSATANDPVVTRSYVDNVFAPSIRAAANNAIQSDIAATQSRLRDQMSMLSNHFSNASAEEMIVQSSSNLIRDAIHRMSMAPMSTTRNMLIQLPDDMTMALVVGSTFVLERGQAYLATTAINLTTGIEQQPGTAMTINHIYLTVEGGRAVNGSINAVLRVDGTYRFERTYREQFSEHAHALRSLGLFRGSHNGFELNRPLTREEAVIFMIRFLGLEEAAVEADLPNPFDDHLPSWARPHIAYAHQRGYVRGMGGTMEGQFGFGRLISMPEFITLVLRTLGYTEEQDGFRWTTAPDFATEIELFTYAEMTEFRNPFMRDHVAYLGFYLLFGELRDEDITVLDRLIERGVFTMEEAEAAIVMVTMERIESV